MPSWAVELLVATAAQIFAAGAIYSAIRADLKTALNEATRANRRLDAFLLKGN